jgi:hypothetical protein
VQPLIHQSLDFHAALGRLFFYLVQQFELDTGTVLITSNWAPGASVSNSVKSWLFQNSPIFSSESALEMLLNLFSSIGFAFFVAD